MVRSPPPTEDVGRYGILASMCLALVLVVASVSSVNLALTGISLDLGTTSSQLTWIADGYTVALAALVLPFGALGDRLGRRTLLLAGTIVFGLAALSAVDCAISCGPDRLPRRHGHRCSDDHARHALHDHRRVSALEARPGCQRVGRVRQLRSDPRLAHVRSDTRMVDVEGDIRRHRRSCRRLLPCLSDPRAEHGRPGGGRQRPTRLRTLRHRNRRPDLLVHRRLRGGMDDAERRGRPGGRCCVAPRVRPLGASCRPADARRPAVRPSGVQYGNSRIDGAVPVPLRFLPSRPAVPSTDPRLQPAAQRCSACCRWRPS